jgi:hypothetical protein
MIIEEKDIEIIRADFNKMESREDFLILLNNAKFILYGDNYKPFGLKQLTWYCNPAINRSRYISFNIKKKNGGSRTIHAPVKGLKSIQRVLCFILQCIYEPHQAAMGFVVGRSIVDNARLHEGSKYVYNIDLKDFFPSIDQARVWKCLQLRPFNLVDTNDDNTSEPRMQTGMRRLVTDHGEVLFYKIRNDKITLVPDRKGDHKRYQERLTSHLSLPEGTNLDDLFARSKLINRALLEDLVKHILAEENLKRLTYLVISRLGLANMIASLCCTEMEVERKENEEWIRVKKNVLPQGAPTSPVITNIVCQRLDHILTGVAKRFGLKYSRYADDITFSSMHNVYQEGSDFLVELNRVIKEQGFHIKQNKTRLQKEGFRQEVTGLVVNSKANVRKSFIKQLRMWLYYWERYGYDRAYTFFVQQYVTDKGHVKEGKPDMANVIQGKLDYLKMVRGEGNEVFQQLKKRYIKLIGGVELLVEENRNNHLTNVLDIFDRSGFDQAINYYKPAKDDL